MLPQVKGASFKSSKGISFSNVDHGDDGDVEAEDDGPFETSRTKGSKAASSLKGKSFEVNGDVPLTRGRSVHFGQPDEVEFDGDQPQLFVRQMSAHSRAARSPSARERSPLYRDTGESRSPTRGSTRGSRGFKSPQKLRFADQSDGDDDGRGRGADHDDVDDDDRNDRVSRHSSGNRSRRSKTGSARSGDSASGPTKQHDTSGRWASKYSEQPKPGGQAAEVLDRLLGKRSGVLVPEQTKRTGSLRQVSAVRFVDGRAEEVGEGGSEDGGEDADEEHIAGDFLRVESKPTSPLAPLHRQGSGGGEGEASIASPPRGGKGLWKAAAMDWKKAAAIDPADPDIQRVGLPKKLAVGVADVVLAVKAREAEARRKEEARQARLRKPREVLDPRLERAMAYFKDKAGTTQAGAASENQWIADAVRDAQKVDPNVYHSSDETSSSGSSHESVGIDFGDSRGGASRGSRKSTGRRSAKKRRKRCTLVAQEEGKMDGGTGHEFSVNCIVFSTDGELMVTGGGDGNVILKRRNEYGGRKQKEEEEADEGGEVGKEKSEAGEGVEGKDNGEEENEGGGANATWEEEARIHAHTKAVWSVDVNENKTAIATGGADEKVKVWVVGQHMGEEMPEVEIRKMLGARKEKSTGTKQEIFERLMKVMKSEENEAKRDGFFAKYMQGERQWVCSAVYSPSAKMPKNGGEEQQHFAMKARRGSDGVLDNSGKNNACFCVRFHPEGQVLATAWADGGVRMFTGKRAGTRKNSKGLSYTEWLWRKFQTIEEHRSSVFAMTYTPKGESLITASKDETILVWAHPSRIKDGYKLTSRLKGHMAPALGVCVHPTGLLMATCSCDQTAVLWSVPDEGKMGEARDLDWQSVSTILGHGDYVKGVSFRDDGRILATASRDKTVRLWATPARPRGAHARALFCLDRLVMDREIYCVSFGNGPSGALLVIGSFGGGIVIWDTNSRVPYGLLPQWRADPFDVPGEDNDLVMHNNGNMLDSSRVSSRPLTAMSDWSRMADPSAVAPLLDVPASLFASLDNGDAPLVKREAILYTRHANRARPSEGGWSTLGPRVMSPGRAPRKYDHTALSMMHKQSMRAMRERVTAEDVAKVRRVAVMFFEKEGMDSMVEVDEEGLVCIISQSGYLDVASIEKVLGRICRGVSALASKGPLSETFPKLKHGNKAANMLGKFEVEVLLGLREAPDPKKGFGNVRDEIAKMAALVQGEAGRVEGLKVAKVSDKGDELAEELSTMPMHIARRIIGEKFMAIIVPQLSWTKTGQRAAGQATDHILKCMLGGGERVKHGEPSETLRRMCHLATHKGQLMDRVNVALAEIESGSISSDKKKGGKSGKGGRRSSLHRGMSLAEMQKQLAQGGPGGGEGGQGGEGGEGGEGGGESTHVVSTLGFWAGSRAGVDVPNKERCQAPLYASSEPTWIGTVFSPKLEGQVSLVSFQVFVTLGTTVTTDEARDQDRGKMRGVSMRLKVCDWDPDQQRITSVLYETEEMLVVEREYRGFVLDMDGHVEMDGSRHVMLCCSTEACYRYTHGAAWVGALGIPSEREKRRGAKDPVPPPEMAGGMWALAGVEGGKLSRFVRQDEVLACRIVYKH